MKAFLIEPKDVIAARDRKGDDVKYRVEGVYLGAVGYESLVELRSLTLARGSVGPHPQNAFMPLVLLEAGLESGAFRLEKARLNELQLGNRPPALHIHAPIQGPGDMADLHQESQMSTMKHIANLAALAIARKDWHRLNPDERALVRALEQDGYLKPSTNGFVGEAVSLGIIPQTT